MYYEDHHPPHFHREYRGLDAVFDLRGRIIAGSITSGTALRLIERWAFVHRLELELNWHRLRSGRPIETIEPIA
jgi:hypothetical protein